MRVWIAEKPSVGRAIASHLPGPQRSSPTHIECGNGEIVTWCRGHILSDYKPEQYSEGWSWKGLAAASAANGIERTLPMVPSEWKLDVSKDAKDQFSAVKGLVAKATEIVHAGDIDREGQMIVDEVLEYLGCRKPVYRCDTSSLDDVNLSRATKNLSDNSKNRLITVAGKCRQRGDWLFGMNLTVAYTFAARRNGYNEGVLNIGRVKTPTMRLVVERDRAIENFKPTTYFVLSALFETSNGAKIVAEWQPNPDRIALDAEDHLVDRTFADRVVSKISGAQATVTQYTDEEKRQNAPLPYSLSDLQAHASRAFGFPVNRTLEIAQKLYEAKITTYPRTDCRYLKDAQHAEAAGVLKNIAAIYPDFAQLAGAADVSRKSKAFNDGKVTAHHAIIPTPQRADISRLSDDERKIYDLIVRRYVAQFYPEYRYRSAKIELECGGEVFIAEGQVPVHQGWKAVYGAAVAEDDDEEGGDEKKPSSQALPRVDRGEHTTCKGAKVGDRQTKPPPRFTEGTLVKAMAGIHKFVNDPEIKKRLRENDGIGTEATRGPMIEQLKKGGFFTLQGKTLMSTPAARALIDAVHPKVSDYGYTAVFEQGLSAVAEGKIPPESFMEKILNFVKAGCAAAAAASVRIPPGAAPARKGGRSSGKPWKGGAGKGGVARKSALDARKAK